MSEFNPSPHDRLVIGGRAYRVMPHPSVPAFAFGQEGRKAFVYQVSDESGNLYALKKFKQAFRVPELVDVCDALARFASWPGLEVCARQCLHRGAHDDALDQYPDLEFAVLMPWIAGSTWYDMIIAMTPLSRLEALTFANATAQVLSALEEAGLAHGDIAAANVIINPNTGRVHLIDVEDLYAPGFSPPAALPAGTDGYAHRTAADGLWGPESDRFSGAVLIAEMIAWHVPEIRKKAEEEHYFAVDEMQQDSPRYRLMRGVLEDLDPRLADLFDQAWFSETLDQCPRLQTWYEVIHELYHREKLAEVVTDWQPIAFPAESAPERTPRPLAPEGVEEPASPAPVSTPEPTEPPPAVTPSAPRPAVRVQEADAAQELASAPDPLARTPLQITPPPPASPVVEWRPLLIPEADPPAPGGDDHHSPTVEEETDASPRPVGVLESLLKGSPPEREAPAEENTGGTGTEPVAPAEPTGASDGLLKPLLDLSHIDGRNRPYLVWTASPGATHYVLQEAQSPDFSSPKEFRVKGGETRWHPRWGRSGRLFYRVRACAGDRTGPWSEVLSLRIGRA